MMDQKHCDGNTIRLTERVAFSRSFKLLYKEGMSLVEEAVAYLDGKGREDSLMLSRALATLYATESMRLTTRLMQVASWLLLQRAVRSGELTSEQVALEKAKVQLDTPSVSEDLLVWIELPAGFIDIVVRSLRFQTRVRHLDGHIYSGSLSRSSGSGINPVSEQLVLLQTAFGRR